MNWLGDQDQAWLPGIDEGTSHRVLITTADRRVAINESGAPLFVSLNSPLISDQKPCLAGTLNGLTYYGVRASEMAELSYEPLRPVLIQLNSEDFIPVNAVMQVLDFFEEHRFCGRCGNEMRASKSDRGRYCESCGLTQYPRISPCIIVLITRGDEILLARAPRFVDGMYSTLAGFVEAGESAEHACHREIGEEVGVRIKSPIYQGSQSWPFKHSLMLGYRAEWLSGDIVIDGIEIVDAQWFNIKHLPKLPPHASISRGMIDAYIKEHLS